MSDPTDIRVIPPLIPLATMSLGYALHLVWPIPLPGAAALSIVGWAMITASVIVVGLGVMELRRAGTTADVRKSATKLVTTGIYRYTRNPMYLSLMLLCWGLAVVVGSLSMLLFAIPTGSILCLAVIRKEEAALDRVFADEYARYRRAVRRWA